MSRISGAQIAGGLVDGLAADGGRARTVGAAAVGHRVGVAGDHTHASIGTPSAVAAIWPMMVSVPWPCSVTPTAQMTPPLGSSLMTQASCSEIGAPPAP